MSNNGIFAIVRKENFKILQFSQAKNILEVYFCGRMFLPKELPFEQIQ